MQARAAAVVLQHLDPLQQQLYDLQTGTLSGDWEGALKLVGWVIDALRQVGSTHGTEVVVFECGDLCCFVALLVPAHTGDQVTGSSMELPVSRVNTAVKQPRQQRRYQHTCLATALLGWAVSSLIQLGSIPYYA